MGVDFSRPESPKLKACKSAFQEWHIDQVAMKWRAVAARKQAGTLPSNIITRAGYFDIFAGLSIGPIRDSKASPEVVACTFLALPMWMFNAFDIDKAAQGKHRRAHSNTQKASHHFSGAESSSYYDDVGKGAKSSPASSEHASTVGRVNMMHLFTGLCMFCRGPLKTRTRVCFELFDDDLNGTMDKSEMRAFLANAVRTLYVLDMMAQLPRTSEIRKMADSMFEDADADNNGCLSPDEFFRWARKHMRTRPLMMRLRQVC